MSSPLSNLIAKIRGALKEALGLEQKVRLIKVGPPPAPAPKPKPKPKPKPPPAPRQFTMYDSVDINEIPGGPEAVAGYVDGLYANYVELRKRFPKAKHLSIAVFSNHDAECLDVEPGNATPKEVGPWVQRQKTRGVTRPCIYASLDTMPQIKSALTRAGIKRSQVRLWVAQYTGVAHIPLGYDACQWWDRAHNKNLDISLCEPGFLP